MALHFNLAILFALFAFVAAAQFDFFGGYPGGFGGASPRDPRDNRGPVTFPVTPGSGSETSGVRIGASGYGFVPPGSRGGHIQITKLIIPWRKHLTKRIFATKKVEEEEKKQSKEQNDLTDSEEGGKLETDISLDGKKDEVEEKLEDGKEDMDKVLHKGKKKIFNNAKNFENMILDIGAGPYGHGPSAFEGFNFW